MRALFATMPVIYVPTLHSRLLPPLSQGVLALDPGLAPPASASHPEIPPGYRPESLPFPPAEARAALAEMVELGGQAANLKDMAYFSAAGRPDFYSGTSKALVDQLEGMEEAQDAGRPSREQLVAAQMTLILALTVETRELEMADLTGRVEAGWSGLSAALDGNPQKAGGLGLDMTPLSAVMPDWRPVIMAALTLTPQTAVLATARADVVEELEELGVAFRPATSEEAASAGLEGEFLLAEAEGWRLAGRKRSRPDMPWLDAPRRLFAWRS